LNDILEQQSRFHPMLYYHRVNLAITILSSVFQLYGTP
jgi:hypothetical protein